MDKKQVYKLAIDTYGADAQMEQAIEECAELIVALKHYKRGKAMRSQVVSELSDVTNMVEQVVEIFDCEDEFRKVRDDKLRRLVYRMDGGES